MMEFLTGNPFSTPVGQRIERATGSSLQTEDWGLNMEICDIVNATDEGPKDAVRAVKKRIVGNKNFREVMLALTVLEACVKNCGQRFHILVSTREFVEGVLVRTIIPKNNPPLVLHDRVLSIIQAWADAFRSSPDLTGVVSVYEDLRRKGLEFPMTELHGYSPVLTPQSAGNQGLPGSPNAVMAELPSPTPLSVSLRPNGPLHSRDGAAVFTPYQMKKLKADLGVVQSNLNIMTEMMTQLDPVTAKHTDMELLQLYTACKDMQERIVELVPRVSEEKLIQELLAANDQMNTTFTRYQRFERQISNGENASQQNHTYVNLIDLNLPTKAVNQSGVAAAPPDSYVNQSTVDSMTSQMTNLSTSEANHLDSFAQKRDTSQSGRRDSAVDGLADAHNSRLDNAGLEGSPGSTRSASPQLDWMIGRGMIPVSQSSVMDDIEKWLNMDDEDDDFGESDGVTSEEFDRFLAERQKAADRMPSLRASSQDHKQS